MRQSTKLFFSVFLLTVAVAWAQQPYQALGPDLLVRLSYESWPGQQICISVNQDGDYRVIAPRLADALRLKGKMTDDQLLRLKKMLAADAFRSLSSNDAGMIRDHAESFRAEVWRVEMPPAFRLENVPTGHPRMLPGPPRRMHWLSADDENPFPAPIAELIDWMENFKPKPSDWVENFKRKNAKPFDYPESSDVCPSVGFSLVQPSIAANGHPQR